MIGTLLTAPAMFYLTASVLGCGAFFMLVEIAERDRSQIDDLLAISLEAFGVKSSHETNACYLPQQITSIFDGTALEACRGVFAYFKSIFINFYCC